MTENECVNKQAILDAINAVKPSADDYDIENPDNKSLQDIAYWAARDMFDDIVSIVEGATPTECKPVVHAYWIKHDTSAKCSNCRQKIDRLVSQYYSFCPFCSADMRQESEENSEQDNNNNA